MKPRGTFEQFLFVLLTLLSLISTQVGFVRAASPAIAPTAQQAQDLLVEMTPEEKVGQLFITGFTGSEANETTRIHDLIVNYHVGGVMLNAANDNFVGGTDTIQAAYTLIGELQQAEWDAKYNIQPDPVTGETNDVEYIPLLIGIVQQGDGAPSDQIISGFTSLPSAMALGASWNTNLARQAGAVLGDELSALGVNLVITSALDVLGPQDMGGSAALGVQSFGGNPYWNARLGTAYVEGIHQGSDSRMLVAAGDFPGNGYADRDPGLKVATVSRTLEQLDQFELRPYYAVTGQATDAGATVDGLVISHSRYVGLQGNVRSGTRPLSFDATAIENLMSFPSLMGWRRDGGLLISENLGSPAILHYFSPSGEAFNAHQIALNAFLAGNDLLYVDNFIATGDEDAAASLINTLTFFAQKYREDAAFAKRVDAAVERILTKKMDIYPSLILGAVSPSQNELEGLGQSSQVSFDVAQNAATLISPNAAQLSLAIPDPPGLRDRIVFFTDTLVSRQCSTCIAEYMLPYDGFANAVVRLYGPAAGGQVVQYNLSSFSFEDLTSFLNGANELSAGQQRAILEDALSQADWVVFSMLNVDEDRPESLAIHRLLEERPDLINRKHLITFAFNAPYFLDATDISQMTAYYGLYSKTPAFVDVAARILFGELTPLGSLPVSVPGSGYDLERALSPEPSQVIPLHLDLPDEAPGVGTEAADVLPMFEENDILPLVTGVIFDRNRHIVPDGTPVDFVFSTGGEGGLVQQIRAVTRDGVARASYQIRSIGLLQIQVRSGDARTSEILLLDISSSGAVAITAIVPTVAATEIVQSTVEPSPTPEQTPTPVVEENTSPGFINWLVSITLIWGASIGIFFLGQRKLSIIWGLRWGLLAAVGGLLMYIYLSLGFPGSQRTLTSGMGGILGSVGLGVLAGWLVGWFWQWYSSR
ncbi:MAG: glycoside hydrolase family 3 N-terminal domain-containing protein [Anaerolineaceae bacterium]|jgi:beta-N-acetylhexosaminidase|nr:glycoside hydrolase family 3 N-terminal domain-containing protein [Anaerolineaceae bacterium]